MKSDQFQYCNDSNH